MHRTSEQHDTDTGATVAPQSGQPKTSEHAPTPPAVSPYRGAAVSFSLHQQRVMRGVGRSNGFTWREFVSGLTRGAACGVLLLAGLSQLPTPPGARGVYPDEPTRPLLPKNDDTGGADHNPKQQRVAAPAPSVSWFDKKCLAGGTPRGERKNVTA